MTEYLGPGVISVTVKTGDGRIRFPAFFCVVKINAQGANRSVLDGKNGMTFIVDSFTQGLVGPVAHVRDYRYKNDFNPYQIWSLTADQYEIIAGKTKWAYPDTATDMEGKIHG